MFFGDAQGVVLAREAHKRGYFEEVEPETRRWLVMPLMHSELLADQELCVELCEKYGLDETLKHAKEHRQVIAKFGRFPHRNELVGRESTEAEKEYLAEDGENLVAQIKQ